MSGVGVSQLPFYNMFWEYLDAEIFKEYEVDDDVHDLGNICGCDIGRPCLNCPFDYESEEEPNDKPFFNDRGVKGQDSIENLYRRDCSDRDFLKKSREDDLRKSNRFPVLKIHSLAGDVYDLEGAFEEEDIVRLMKSSYPELEDDNFYIYCCEEIVEDDDVDVGFVREKEEMGLFPDEIRDKILSGDIKLIDGKPQFILIYKDSGEEPPVSEKKDEGFVYCEEDFMKLKL